MDEPRQYATGGLIQGDGAGITDSVAANLIGGCVISAAQLRKLGKPYITHGQLKFKGFAPDVPRPER